MRTFPFLISLLVMALMFRTQVQEKKITGVVTDAQTRKALPGVTIMVKGSTIGATTQINGTYSIVVPADKKILVFNMANGKTQEIVIGTKTNINVAMQPLSKKQKM